MRKCNLRELERRVNEHLATINYYECIELGEAYLRRLTPQQRKLLGKKIQWVLMATNEIRLRVKEGRIK